MQETENGQGRSGSGDFLEKEVLRDKYSRQRMQQKGDHGILTGDTGVKRSVGNLGSEG